MEEKLVKVLLDQYKEKGIDMYALLDDTFFKNLSLQQKVDMIKKHAAEISAGTNRALTKKDIRSLIIDASVSGLSTGLAAGVAAQSAHRFFKNGKGMMPMGAVLGAAALGAAVSAGTTYLGSRKIMKDRHEILKKIDETVKDPSDENALKVLVGRGHQLNAPTSASISSRSAKSISNTVSDLPNVLMNQVEPWVAHRAMQHNFAKNYNEYADGVDVHSFGDAVNEAHENLYSRLHSSMDNMRRNFY